jgi:Ca-activated chloride channel family protein
VIILLTDGVMVLLNQRPADIATIYTIGIGTNGMAEFPYAVGPNGQFYSK